MRKNKKTIDLAYIRRKIRHANRWHEVDEGMPTFWSSDNFKNCIKMKGKVLKKSEKHYKYYTRSEKAIKEIAEQIYNRCILEQNGETK